MIILAIETSCDDTCVSIVEADKRRYQRGLTLIKILSNIVSSQVKLHARYGGVWPYLAKREHQRNLPIVFNKALRKAGFLKSKINPSTTLRADGERSRTAKNQKSKIDLVAITVGPGLEPCLWVGVNFAKDLAKNLNLPIIPVNHIEAHIFANFLSSNNYDRKHWSSKEIFPAVCLVVSGGHTQLILMKDFLKYKILGETRDDAAGECFDKTARVLGLSYPGGPAIARQAATLNLKPLTLNLRLPRPMIYQKNYDFSFSGLKTAVLYDFKNCPPKVRKSKIYIQEMAKEVQQAIIDVLIYKTLKAAKNFKAKSIILGGGVASNEELRRQFKKEIKKELPNIQYLKPNIQFCTDNAVMVGVTAYFNWLKRRTKPWQEIKADANLRIS